MKPEERDTIKDQYYELTQSQLLIWTGQQMSMDSPMYNMALAFTIGANIDEKRFAEAFRRLLSRCDAMRTVFVQHDGQAQQRICAHFPFTLEVLDFSRKVDALQPWLVERSQRPFDIEACLFDAVLIRLPEDRYCWYFNQHHLITDAWAMTLQFQAVAGIYGELSGGNDAFSPSLPAYASYVRYEAERRQSENHEQIAEYWRKKRRQLPDPPDFFGRNNRQLQSRSERMELVLSEAQSEALRALTAEPDLRTWTQHLSLFNLFATLVITYLYRITGQQKLAIGTPAHNRTTADFKATPGLFIELFPLVAEIDPRDNYSSLFQKLRNEAYEFLRYAQTGASTPALNRSFNVVLNYINASFGDFNDYPTQTQWIHSAHADPGHYLRVQVHDFPASGRIHLCFDLNTAIFDSGQRQKITGQFEQLIDRFIQDRFQPIGQMALEERKAEPVPVMAPSLSFPWKSVTGCFEEQLAQRADQTAIQYGESRLSYGQLNRHANQMAQFLQANGAGPGDRIALYLNRSPELIISILATLKIGAVFIPVPTSYPSGRVLGILESAQAKCILSHEVLARKLPRHFDQLISLDREGAFIGQQPDTSPGIVCRPEQPAYMIYTSGSTGQPKGVVIPHGALSHYLQWAAHYYAGEQALVMPLFSSIGFDLTITSLFLPLITGGAIVTYPEPESGPDLSLLQVLDDNRVNAIKLTPSHLALLKGQNFAASNIRTMIVGGEHFKTDLAEATRHQFPQGLEIYNEYGPTEATVGCVVHRYQPERDRPFTSVPIGRPIPGVQIYILDEFQHTVPEGVTGEMYIGGAGLASSYWQQPELTARHFIAHPFEAGARLYQTGDLARIHPEEGHIEYLGRKDQQVKIRGRRVELAEIETVLNQQPGISRSVVTLRHRRRTQEMGAVQNCVKCGLPSNYPSASFDDHGVCHLCQSFQSYQEKVKAYFKDRSELKDLLSSVAPEQKGDYDCLVLLSGGKDSTYCLARLQEMGFRILAFTLDNGYISREAKDNIRRVVTELGVDHSFGETEAMNDIFVDSLMRHCNVCDGCFKTIYTLSVQIALEKKIPFIVTGLSRGQFFETRLTEELFLQPELDVDKIDDMILQARREYHQVDDAVRRLLDVSMFDDDSVFEKVRFVDFYRYTDVSLEEMLRFLNNRLPWVRPSDTGRSTNCLINQAGIYVHKKERGYSNYAFPYSWDVRLGHKTRTESLEEINETIDEPTVHQILQEIGYTEARSQEQQNEQLVAYYTGDPAVEEVQLRSDLLAHFPDYMVPVQFIHLEQWPITVNGKIDREALPAPDVIRPVLETAYVEPRTEFEEIIREIWAEVLQIDRIGVMDNFLDMGGDSLSGIRIMSRLNQAFELELAVNLIFQNPTIAQLASHIEATITSLLQELEGS